MTIGVQHPTYFDHVYEYLHVTDDFFFKPPVTTVRSSQFLFSFSTHLYANILNYLQITHFYICKTNIATSGLKFNWQKRLEDSRTLDQTCVECCQTYPSSAVQTEDLHKLLWCNRVYEYITRQSSSIKASEIFDLIKQVVKYLMLSCHLIREKNTL